jgi:hypothetical protein
MSLSMSGSGVRRRCPAKGFGTLNFYAEHPTTSIRFDLSPHSANIDDVSIEY